MRLPRIALCSFSYGAQNGIARMDALLEKGLARLGFAVTSFLIVPQLPAGGSHADGLYEGGRRVLELASALEILEEAFAEADIVQFNGAFDPVVSFAAARARVPVVIEAMHNTEPGGLHPDTDMVVCVSEVVRGAQVFPRCTVIHNGIDCKHFSFKPGRRAAYPVLLQVANSAKKLCLSLDELFPSVRALYPDCQALFAGGRPVTVGPGMTDSGVVQDIAPLYHAADFNVLACPRDPYGLTVAEGMACGCLPLVHKNSGSAALVEHGKSGWLLHDDRECWITCIANALEMLGGPEHERMREHARRHIEQYHGENVCLARYADLYRELWRASPERKERFAPTAWMPLLQAAMYGAFSLDEALRCFESFIRAGLPLEPQLLRHPLSMWVFAVAERLCDALLRDGHKSYVRAFCALMRAGRIRGSFLDALERRCGGSGPH